MIPSSRNSSSYKRNSVSNKRSVPMSLHQSLVALTTMMVLAQIVVIIPFSSGFVSIVSGGYRNRLHPSSTAATQTTTGGILSTSTSLNSAVVFDNGIANNSNNNNGGIDWFRRQREVPQSQSQHQQRQGRTVSKQSAATATNVGTVPRNVQIQSLEHFNQYIQADGDDRKRYTVVKFHASWCKTCAKFGLRFDKLLAEHADWVPRDSYTAMSNHEPMIHRSGPLRFASVDYSSNADVFTASGVTHLPTVHIYDEDGNKVVDCACPPSKFQEIANTINMYVSQYHKNQLEREQQQKIGSSTSHQFSSAAATTTATMMVPDDQAVRDDDDVDNVDDSLQSSLYRQATVAAMQVSYRPRSFDTVDSPSNVYIDQQQQQRKGWWRRRLSL